MRLGLFGGSFDPVHNGHLLLAVRCQRAAALDEVWFVPAATQPLKRTGPVASDDERCQMLTLATQGHDSWKVSRIEIDRGGVSYTVDTLRQVAAKHPKAELFFLMGADSLHDLPKWVEPQEILTLATPLVVARAGEGEPDFESLSSVASPERVEAIRQAKVEMPATPISSSEIRRRLSVGDDVEEMVPAGVLQYIRERGLYGTDQ